MMTITERERAELEDLYADFAAAGLMPLWTQRDDLMPMTPQPGRGAAPVAVGGSAAAGGAVGAAVLVARIEAIGECRNACIGERP